MDTFAAWEWKLRWKATKPWCFRCIYLKFHYFHDDGSPVEGWLKAKTDCDQCHMGVPHTFHDKKAFNTNLAYDGG